MAVDDRYQVKYRYRVEEHICENVLNYVQITAGTAENEAEMLAIAFDAYFIDLFAAVQSVLSFNTYIDVANLDDTTENYRLGVSLMSAGGGVVSGERRNYTDAYLWTKTPVNRIFKTGLFRLRGVPEGRAFGEKINPDELTAFNTITAALPDDLTGSNGSVFHPIILRRLRIPSDPAEPFAGWLYSHTDISGINFKEISHLVNNK